MNNLYLESVEKEFKQNYSNLEGNIFECDPSVATKLYNSGKEFKFISGKICFIKSN